MVDPLEKSSKDPSEERLRVGKEPKDPFPESELIKPLKPGVFQNIHQALMGPGPYYNIDPYYNINNFPRHTSEERKEALIPRPTFPVLPTDIESALSEIEAAAINLGLTLEQINVKVNPDNPEATLRNLQDTLNNLTLTEPSQAFSSDRPTTKLKPCRFSVEQHLEESIKRVRRARRRFSIALATLLILLVACDRINEPSANTDPFNPTATAAEVLPTVAATANPLDQIEATTTAPDSTTEAPFSLKDHLIGLEIIIDPETPVETIEWAGGTVQMIRVTQLVGEDGILKNVSEFVGYEDYVALVYVAPPIETNSTDKFIGIGLRAGEDFRVDQQTGEYLIVDEAGKVMRKYDPITRSFVEVEEEPTSTMTATLPPATPPTPEVTPTPEATPIPPPALYDRPEIPANLNEVFAGREVDKVYHYEYVGEGLETGISFPIFTGHEGLDMLEGNPYREIRATELLVQIMGKRHLMECHYRYNFDRRNTGGGVSYEEYLDLVRRGEGHYNFNHYQEVSPGNFEIAQTLVDPRMGTTVGLEVIDDLAYDYYADYGFPRDVAGRDVLPRFLADLRFNEELGQPVTVVSLSAKSWKDFLDTNQSLQAMLSLNAEAHYNLALRIFGGADEYWTNGSKKLEYSKAADNYWNEEFAKAMWSYYYHDVEPPENLLDRLKNGTLPEIESNMYWEAYYKMISEGIPYLFIIKE